MGVWGGKACSFATEATNILEDRKKDTFSFEQVKPRVYSQKKLRFRIRNQHTYETLLEFATGNLCC